jgi:spore coat protein U-like protein
MPSPQVAGSKGNNFMKRLLVGCTACLGISLLFPPPALAATATTTMAVSADVTAACTITATPMAFGAYSQTANVDTTSEVTVQCTGTSGALGFTVGDGNNFLVSRRMTVGASFLDYTVSVTVGAAAVASPTAVPITISPATGAGTATLFGRIIPQGNKIAGTYTDTVTLTLTY